MRVSIDPSVDAPEDVTAESLALALWYDSHPAVRRLWGVKMAQGLRVIVAIEPALDSDDVFPSWLANKKAWSREIQQQTGSRVLLEVIRDLPCDGIEVDPESLLIADLFWRDVTLDDPYDAL